MAEDAGILDAFEVAEVTDALDLIGCSYRRVNAPGGTWVLATGIRDVSEPVTQHDVEAALPEGYALEWSTTRQIAQRDAENHATVVKA